MTREEKAIDLLDNLIGFIEDNHGSDYDEAFKIAIKALKAIEDIKSEIDNKQYDFMANKDYDEGARFGLMLAYQIIDKHMKEGEA